MSDTDTVTVTLSERAKPQNQSESTSINVASALGIEVAGFGPVVCQLARELIRRNLADPFTAVLHVVRDGSPAFLPAPLWKWAGLSVSEGSTSASFQKFTAFSR